MVQRGRRGQIGQHVGDLGGVRPRCLDPRLRLGDARSRDHLLGFGDLLDRLRGPDPPAQFAKCCSHTESSLLLRWRRLTHLDRLFLDVLFVHRVDVLVGHRRAAVGRVEAPLELVDDVLELAPRSPPTASSTPGCRRRSPHASREHDQGTRSRSAGRRPPAPSRGVPWCPGRWLRPVPRPTTVAAEAV